MESSTFILACKGGILHLIIDFLSSFHISLKLSFVVDVLGSSLLFDYDCLEIGLYSNLSKLCHCIQYSLDSP